VLPSWKTGKDSGTTTCSKAARARAEERLVLLEEEEEAVLAGADDAIAACVVDSEDEARECGKKKVRVPKGDICIWDDNHSQ
jgi:hypothetical protein